MHESNVYLGIDNIYERRSVQITIMQPCRFSAEGQVNADAFMESITYGVRDTGMMLLFS